MKLALIGLPQSGKSTVFNALTGSENPLVVSAGRVEVQQAVVEVPDSKLRKLAKIWQSKKIVHAQITFADVAGFGIDEGSKGLSAQLLNALSGMDGFLIVVRAFEDEAVLHPSGSIDPARDLAALQDDLLLNDLIRIERKLGRLQEERQKGTRDKQAIEREQSLFNRLQAHLNENKLLSEMTLSENERESLAGLGLLTYKPMMAVLNLGEGQKPPGLESEKVPVISLQGKLEMELAQLPAEDIDEFLKEYGIKEMGAQRVIRAAYELLEIQTFYTAAENETHAWILKRGASALDAAGTVHSDIARGFIRAEIIGIDELIELGSMAKAREVGKLRLEGKDYSMRDGDILNVRFNV